MTDAESNRIELRTFVNASRSRVFAAWTNPELITQWFAPGSMTVPSAVADPRVGGRYQIEMHGDMGGEVMSRFVTGTYRKVVPNELLQFTWAWTDAAEPESLVTVELKEVDGGTEVILTHEKLANTESRVRHAEGWQGCLANLSARLPALA